MRVLIVLCALVPLLVAQMDTTTGPMNHDDIVECDHDSDCADDQCCSKQHMIGGVIGKKRFILDDLFPHLGHGHCKALAAEGETCEPNGLHLGGSSSHHFGCPCAAGLECHGEHESHHGGSHSYNNPKCMQAGTYTGPTAAPHTTMAAVDTSVAPVE